MAYKLLPIARFFVSYVIGRNHKVQSSKLKVQRIERICPYVILSKDAAYTKKRNTLLSIPFVIPTGFKPVTS